MLPVESLRLNANHWRFLCKPERYVKATEQSEHPLVLESTRRQFLTARDILARLNGSEGHAARRGILLADDVGLGKTTVAALVAWVVASAGETRGVRVLAPNDVMMRRWRDELLSHVTPLKECAPAFKAHNKRVKAQKLARLSPGTIQVVKHSYAGSKQNLACDLLIVDEAHRAKGDNTVFSRELKRQKKYARRVLILTATPFSIHLEELARMLMLVDGDAAIPSVRAYRRALDDLYNGNSARSAEVVADRLASKANAAIDALKACVVRHGIDDLPAEHAAFGHRKDWDFPVEQATRNDLDVMLRMDRALRVARIDGSDSKTTNDARFHVGWRHLDTVRKGLKSKELPELEKAIVDKHLVAVAQLRSAGAVHPKIAAVGKEVESVVKAGEKVLLFCHHHATAQELTAHLGKVLPKLNSRGSPSEAVWKRAWNRVLEPVVDDHDDDETLHDTFVAWLSDDLIRAQTWSWLQSAPVVEKDLATALKNTKARCPAGQETIARAAQHLYRVLRGSRSSSAVLIAAEHQLGLLPGGNRGLRVLGVCESSESVAERDLFTHNRQPDTVISIFNSPFGPDVLVVTDKLSEGVDLHRYCRHLIHYELDPSPIRTVQRNGRLRRVNSWAAAIRKDIRYAYPAFRGTRDHRLVQIMKKRVDCFSLLLGGVPDFNVEEVDSSEEKWRNEVIGLAKRWLAETGGRLRARDPDAGEE